MTVHHPVLGSVEVTLTARALARIQNQIETSIPGGLVPLVARHYQIDEYRLLMGWPHPVPTYDVQTITEATVTGEAISYRPDPFTITTNAILRWCASHGYGAALWEPVQYGTEPVYMAISDHAPTLITDYQYRVNDERFNMDALVFDSDFQTFLDVDLTGRVGGQGMTILMVCSPSAPTGLYAGLFGNSNTSGDYYQVNIQGQYLYTATEDVEPQRGPPINPALNSNSPFYIAMVLGRPNTVLYAGQGPSSLQVASLPVGEGSAMPSTFTLGRIASDVLHNVDMALFDIGIYPNALNSTEVAAEFASLSQAYGGDS